MKNNGGAKKQTTGTSKIRKVAAFVSERYLNRGLDFRVRLFNVLALAGVLVSIISAVVSLAIGEPFLNAALYTFYGLLSLGLLWYSAKSGRYRFCYMITIASVFLIGFPLFFFNTGIHYGAMPYFFIFAIVFTVFMLDGMTALPAVVLEVAVYTGLCVYAHYYLTPEPYYLDSRIHTIDTVFGFLVVSAAIGGTMFFQIRLYNEQQRELAERNAELDRINRRKTEFLSNISHELKTPLTVVSSHIQIVQKDLERRSELENMQNTVKLIGGEVERMGLMVAQLLDVSRIDEGRMLMEPRRESIIEIIQTTMNTYYPVFTKNHNRLTFLRTGDIPAVRCDRVRVMQVLVNLIGNATRHTRDGEITVSAGMLDGEAVVTVSDTGEGIAAERMQHLFTRYHSHQTIQTVPNEKARTGWDTGTGLGLYICKHIVEGHSGRIWIESVPHKGTQVHFTLPPDI